LEKVLSYYSSTKKKVDKNQSGSRRLELRSCKNLKDEQSN